MRPLRLRLTAFGPFATAQTIDFTKAYDARLFGIYGATGAGKTSILDGLCFALFGESSGAEREGEELRSHHASPDDETQAELVFEVGERLYHIVRRPKQSVRARRGGGVTERQHWAALYDASGMALEDITADAPGTVIAERKVDHVGAEIRAILNYTAPQFRQVVLLPQGQFRALLTASSDERSRVLRGLFDVSLYEKVVDRLKSEASLLQKAVEQGRADRKAHLGALSLDDTSALASAIDQASAEKEAAITARELAIDKRSTARAALDTGTATQTKFEEHDQAVEALRVLQAGAAEIDALRARRAAAERAKQCQPLQEISERGAADHSKAVEALEAAQHANDLAAEEKSEAAVALSVSEAKQADRDEASATVTRLEEIRRLVDAAEPLRRRAKEAAAALTSAARAAKDASSAVARADEAVKLAAKACQDAQDRELEKAQREMQREVLAREESDAAAYETAQTQVADLEAKATSAKRIAIARLERLQIARAAEQEAEKALGTGQAAHLARSLKPGEPCPVCGSPHHPTPAGGPDAGDGLESAWRQARASRESAEADERKFTSAADVADATWQQAAKALSERISPQRAIADISKDLAGTKARLRALAAYPSLDATKARQNDAEAALSQAAAWTAETSLAQGEAERAASEADGALKGALAHIPDGLDQPAAIKAAIASATVLRDGLAAAHRKVIEAERSASERATASAAARDAAVARERELRAESETRNKAALEAIRTAGFGDTDYEIAKQDIAHIQSFGDRIVSHDNTIVAATARHERARTAIGALGRPDLTALGETMSTAERGCDEAERDVTTISLRLAQLEDARTKIAAIETRLGESETRYGVVGDLALLGDGRNALGMRLRDYAIAATFDLVLEAANLRFVRMSRGRFTLGRKRERGDARARAGLDIEVFDTHTDQARDAHTLSGGEGFLASLSLALGLSDVVQAEAGGVKLDAIFIDEGFGHLDDETLDLALDTLRDLVGHDRAVGVISHVETVKQQVTQGFDVIRTARGSAVSLRPQL